MSRAPAHAQAHASLEEVARTSYGRLLAYLAGTTGDIATAEDALADALLAALSTWPERGVPERPDAWLLTAARRNLIDAARRRGTAVKALPEVARLIEERAEHDRDGVVPDRRLGLLFACAHPAVAAGLRSPLMLQTVFGLDAVRVGAAFLVAPATMGQRLVRAKAKIRAAGVPFALPADARDLPERLEAVLDAMFAAYGTGWDDPGGQDPRRNGLTEEAVRLARLLVALLPAEPEAHGLLALLLHTQARVPARRGPAGEFVPLDEQDTSLWSQALVTEGEHHLATAFALRRVGPYQLQAAIQSVHNRRAVTGSTDWTAVAALYDGLASVAPTTGGLVARAAAHRRSGGRQGALALLDELDGPEAEGYQPYWVLRAHLLSDLGDAAGSREAGRRGLELTHDPAVRDHLLQRLAMQPHPGGPAAD